VRSQHHRVALSTALAAGVYRPPMQHSKDTDLVSPDVDLFKVAVARWQDVEKNKCFFNELDCDIGSVFDDP
jgi:hypothetical protein